MKSLCFILALFAFVRLPAGERQYLWPEGRMPDPQPHQIAAPLNVASAEGFNPDGHRRPYLEWHDTPASNRSDACIILISGGGYNSWYDVGLVKEWERRYSSLGIRCVPLVYRTPRPIPQPTATVEPRLCAAETALTWEFRRFSDSTEKPVRCVLLTAEPICVLRSVQP